MNETEKLLNSVKWEDISILMDERSQPILILLSPNQNEAEKLYTIITRNPFVLKVLVNKETGEHEIQIEITNTEYGIGFKTPKTLENYPPLKFLHNKQVIGITCGFLGTGGQVLYNPTLHPLDGNQIALN